MVRRAVTFSKIQGKTEGNGQKGLCLLDRFLQWFALGEFRGYGRCIRASGAMGIPRLNPFAFKLVKPFAIKQQIGGIAG